LGSGSGYLRALLDALAVPVESQMLVFSKTGVQQAHTSPANPRALFFNDSVAIGYFRGAPLLEIASHDPHQGVIFYTLAQSRAERPTLQRRDQCLSCHVSRSSLDIPGMLVRSNFTEPDGSLLPHLGSHIIDHRSPFDERWGGWYVTGTHGSMRHLGNAVVLDPARPDAASAMVTRDTLNLPSVARHFDTRSYLSPYSDIVALMVFEHQMHMINLITRVGWEVRVAAADGRTADPTTGVLHDAIDELVDYLLFVDEAPLTAKVEGSSGFAARFAEQGPRDRKGRSLRQLDLNTRLMRYPCSYMIHSAAFDSLPASAKDAIYRRTWRILSGEDKDARYARLSPADRRAVIEILRDTVKTLPAWFQ
jgi:hypothetical protein